MKKGITYAAIKNQKMTLFMIVISLIFGLFSYYMLPRQESPDVSAPAALILTIYPGASPEDVEKLVTEKIEDALVEVEGCKFINSTSKNGVSFVVIFLEDGVDPEKTWDEMREKLESVQASLPKECLPMDINTNLSDTAGMIISMAGDDYSYEELADYAEIFKKELSKIDGVSKFEIEGKVDKNIKVKIDIDKLNYYDLSIEDISNVIKSQNTEIPSGKIDDGKTKITVKSNGTYESLKEIEDTIIMVSPESGAVLRLKDIADIYYEVDDSVARYKQNGKKTVLLTGYFEESLNVVLVGRDVEERLEELRKDLPVDIIFEQVTFQPNDVEKSTNGFILNLLEAVIFVVAVVFIGMGARNAAIVSTTIPLSICITFGSMYLFGIKLEQMSISALIIALGMLVDNTIVVSDSIQYYIDEGLDKLEACVRGTKEVAMSILTSTLTTVFAFLPLLLLNSAVGQYIFGVPSVVIIALLASYLCALITTPLMAYFFLEKSKKKNGEKDSKLRKFFDDMLQVAMRKKRLMLVIAVIALIFTGYLATQLEVSMFPKADKDIIYIDVTSENASDILVTEKLSNDVAEILKKQPEVVSITEAIGDGLPKFYMTTRPGTPSSDFGQILIKIDLEKGGRFELRSEFMNYLQGELDENIAGGKVICRLLDVGSDGGSAIAIRVSTGKMERLKEATELITDELESIEGTINIDNDFVDKEYQFYIEVDEKKAGNYGISKYDVQKEVSNALRGNNATTFRKSGNEYNLIVSSNIKTKEELENMAIKSQFTGKKVLLKEIAVVGIVAEYPVISRYNRERSVNITSEVINGYNAKDIEAQIKDIVKELDLDDVTFNFEEGVMSTINESFLNLGILAVFSLFLIITVLIFQFNSYSQPIIILLTIPLSFIGGICGLFITKQPLSFSAMLGLVSLIGIVVNNAIVLIDYINGERENGSTVDEACKKAVYRRFRPIMLSTITTIIGLVPLVISGGELFRPMAVALLGGLSVSTMLTLVVIPTTYSMIQGRLERKRRKRISTDNKIV